MARSDYELSAEDRHEARAAKKILADSGIGLIEAARMALAVRGGRALAAASPLIEEAIDRFLRRALDRKLREQTFAFYETKLGAFASMFHGRRLGDVSRAELRAWFDGLPCSRVTARGHVAAVRALYGWARRCEPPLCAENPCEGLVVEEPISEIEPVVLRAAEVRAVLEGAGEYRAAVALMLLAGVRPGEVGGRWKTALRWEHVDTAARMVRIPAEIAKTRRARVIEGLPDVFWAWMPPAGAGNVSPGMARQATRRAWAAVKPLRPEWKEWPADCMRHTAASYLLALWQDAGRVSMVLGHEGKPSMLYNHYRATMTMAEAQAIAALRPGV